MYVNRVIVEILRFIMILGIILSIIYNIYSNNMGINNNKKGCTNDKHIENYDNIVNTQQDWLISQKQYYNKQNGIGLDIDPNIDKWYKLRDNKLVPIKRKVTEKSNISKKVLACSLITDCNELGNNNECGYCHNEKDNKRDSYFSWGNKDAPKNNVCGGTWTTDKDKCQRIKEYDICNKVNDCGDLYGDAANVCGYCPLTNKAMPVKKQGDTMPKYDNDKCPVSLLNNINCTKFVSNNPCMGINYDTGPHSIGCINKLWKQSKCTNKKPKNMDVNKLVNDNMMHKNYKLIGTDFQDIYKMSKSKKLNEAIVYNMMCHGNTDNINPCDTIYNVSGYPSHKCLKDKFIDAGCGTGNDNAPAKGYQDLKANDIRARGHINDISKLIKHKGIINNINDYVKHIKKIIELSAGKGFYGFDYNKRKGAAKICYGTTPPKPLPIKRGDTVLMRINLNNMSIEGNKMNGLNLFEGIAMNRAGKYIDVMWLKIINEKTRNIIERKNYSKHAHLQSKIFGWPGVSPLNNYNGITNKIDVKNLFVKESCCASFTSGCQISCESMYLNMLNTYKQPKDCVLGWPKGRDGIPNKWSNWSKCNVDCGNGTKIKKRDIIYAASNGGYCPSISNSQRYIELPCNTNKCPMHGISDKMGNFYKNKKLWFKLDSKKNNLVTNSKSKRKGRLIDMFNMCDKDKKCYGVLESNDPSYYYFVWDKKHGLGGSIDNKGNILYKKA